MRYSMSPADDAWDGTVNPRPVASFMHGPHDATSLPAGAKCMRYVSKSMGGLQYTHTHTHTHTRAKGRSTRSSKPITARHSHSKPLKSSQRQLWLFEAKRSQSKPVNDSLSQSQQVKASRSPSKLVKASQRLGIYVYVAAPNLESLDSDRVELVWTWRDSANLFACVAVCANSHRM